VPRFPEPGFPNTPASLALCSLLRMVDGELHQGQPHPHLPPTQLIHSLKYQQMVLARVLPWQGWRAD
jgi:hypothetical protein